MASTNIISSPSSGNADEAPFHQINKDENEKLFSYQPLTIILNESQNVILNKRTHEIFRMVNIEGINSYKTTSFIV